MTIPPTGRIEPYFDRDGIQIYNADTYKTMIQLARAGVKVDLVLADLPYGMVDSRWDKILPFKRLWVCYKALINPGAALVFTANQPFASMLVMSNLEWFRYEWVWLKVMPTGHLNAKKRPMSHHETIQVFCEEPPPFYPQGLKRTAPRARTRKAVGNGSYNTAQRPYVAEHTNYPTTQLTFTHDATIGHPTQKPVALMEYLIATYTKVGDLVLDNTCGSGPTLRAALNLGRRAIGIEISKEYCDMAVSRLHQMALPLFDV